MTDEGFVKLSRKMIGWGWFKDVNTTHLFIYCLMRANFKDTEWKGIKLKRGSFVTSLKHLSEETGLTLQQTRTALEHLISTQEITKQSSFKNTVIIVNNYDKYQDGNTKNNSKSTRYQQGSNKVATQSQQGGNKLVTTDKKEKKYTHPLGDEYTAHAPTRLEGGGHGGNEKSCEDGANECGVSEREDGVRKPGGRKPGESVSWVELIRFARSIPGASDYTASDFYSGFTKSGTRFPEDWQDIFRRLTAAPQEVQWKFLDDLKAGAYREMWGCAD